MYVYSYNQLSCFILQLTIECGGVANYYLYSLNSFHSFPHCFLRMTVLPHLQGVDNYAYIAVLGRGHFGKVCALDVM